MLQQRICPSRRFNSRVETAEGVWVYWRCAGRDDTSRVLDLSLSGLFVETPKLRAVGSTAEVDFLVQEGEIRAEAVVRHVEPGPEDEHSTFKRRLRRSQFSRPSES
jgi:hypothetical protein